MTTPHTDHTHTDPTKPAEETKEQTGQEPSTDAIETNIIFNGLMVFQPDPVNKACQVGVLHVRDHAQPHILQIEIRTDTESVMLDSDLLERYVQDGNIRWNFEVVRGGQPVPPGIVVNTAIPPDRHNPPSGPIGFGWFINLESGEFHSRPLPRKPNQLKPIIQLTKGELFTRCLSDSIDIKQGPNTRLDFGFIAGAAGLKLTPADGDTAILYFIDQQNRPVEIFRLTDIDRVKYTVFIRNTPTTGSAGGHFHLFYDHLFQGVLGNQKFDLQLHYPPNPVPSQFSCAGVDPDPDPFKCGGVVIGSGGGPLG